LREESEEWLTRLLRRLVTAGWVVFSADERPLVLLTEAGKAVMEGRTPARVLLPDRTASGTRERKRGRGSSAGYPAAATSGTRPNGKVRIEREDDPLADESTRSLFEALRAHRLSVARSEAVPPFVVASDRTLRELARLRPRTQSELLEAHGMGPVKAARYGAGFLSVIEQS
jgi:ATP-dependent DNA helicase RecQ